MNQSDQAIERQIQAKGKTAPRITPADIEANIAHEVFFTAAEAVDVTAVLLNPALELLTFCVITLRNGFTVTGESACASPENFDAEIGRNIARQNAVQKIWPLMGYQLRDMLHRRALFDAEPKVSAGTGLATATNTLPPHQQRVIDEKRELDEKLAKLVAFFNTPIFAGLDEEERQRLEHQAAAMQEYSTILGERIAAFAPLA